MGGGLGGGLEGGGGAGEVRAQMPPGSRLTDTYGALFALPSSGSPPMGAVAMARHLPVCLVV